MTPTEALQILDKAVSQMQGTRADHTRIAEAVTILNKVINKDDKASK